MLATPPAGGSAMKFGQPLPRPNIERLFDQNPLNLVTIESEGGLWQIQLNPTLMGSARLNVSHRNVRGCYLTVYCCGEIIVVQHAMLHLVRRIMEGLPEEFEPCEFERMMPRHTIVREPDGGGRELRPITTDPKLVMALAQKAGFNAEDAGALRNLICNNPLSPDHSEAL
jgi:hypothetical protein